MQRPRLTRHGSATTPHCPAHARRLWRVWVTLALVAGACGGAADRTASQPNPDDRQLVSTADLTVRVTDAADATHEATQVAKDVGGRVFSQTSDLQGHREARLTLQVPPEGFDAALTRLAGLGRALTQAIKHQDVTDQVVDLDGRLKTAEASADRLRTLLGAAASTADIVAVEGELTKRETEIESLAGRLQVIHSQVDLATINLRLTERADLEVNREVPGFPTTLRAGSVTVLNLGLALVAAIGFVLPFTPLAAGGWWIIRRRRGTTQGGPGTPSRRSNNSP